MSGGVIGFFFFFFFFLLLSCGTRPLKLCLSIRSVSRYLPVCQSTALLSRAKIERPAFRPSFLFFLAWIFFKKNFPQFLPPRFYPQKLCHTPYSIDETRLSEQLHLVPRSDKHLHPCNDLRGSCRSQTQAQPVIHSSSFRLHTSLHTLLPPRYPRILSKKGKKDPLLWTY